MSCFSSSSLNHALAAIILCCGRFLTVMSCFSIFCRLKAEEMQQGRQTESGELGVLVGQIRRILSVTGVRAQAECLLSRLRNVGSGTGAANRRRQGVVREEVNWARERQAQAVGRRQGRKVVRQGMFLLN